MAATIILAASATVIDSNAVKVPIAKDTLLASPATEQDAQVSEERNPEWLASFKQWFAARKTAEEVDNILRVNPRLGLKHPSSLQYQGYVEFLKAKFQKKAIRFLKSNVDLDQAEKEFTEYFGEKLMNTPELKKKWSNTGHHTKKVMLVSWEPSGETMDDMGPTKKADGVRAKCVGCVLVTRHERTGKGSGFRFVDPDADDTDDGKQVGMTNVSKEV